MTVQKNYLQETVMFTANSSWSMWRFRSDAILEIIKNGYCVTIVAPFDHKTSTLEEMGCRVITLPISGRGLNPFVDFRTFFRLLSIYRREKPRLIFHYTIKPNIYGTIAAKLAGVRSFAVVTGLGHVFVKESWLSKLVTLLCRVSFPLAEQVWFLNAMDKLEFERRRIVSRPDKSFLLGHEGIDVTEYQPKVLGTSKPFSALLICRLLKEKGVIEYVEAAKLIKKTYPDTKFRILGPIDVTSESGILRSQIDNWEQEGIIEYCGFEDDVRPFIEASSCVILPSYYREGVPRVLMEAAAMGKPSITTDTPGCRDVVVDGETGFLCKPRDSRDLATKIEALIRMDDLTRIEFGSRARLRAENFFDISSITKEYLSRCFAAANAETRL